MDSSHNSVAREQDHGQYSAGHAEKARRVPRLPTSTEAAASRTKSQARNRLQHATDQIASQQSTGLSAKRGKTRFGKKKIYNYLLFEDYF